ncbi:hypothetical protein DFH27DRAFT_613130 [Peziza echinospora]|nr:hypothetical protein DFH27DRAFT_613130 [Peziza echinospora]
MSATSPLQLHKTLLQTLSIPLLHSYLTSILPPPPHPPLASLLASLRFRILASDLSDILDTAHPSAHLFPTTSSATAKSTTLQGPIATQIVDVWDVGSSVLEQLEALEQKERGEYKRGMEVIRVVPEEAVGAGTQATQGGGGGGRAASGGGAPAGGGLGPYKLLLEDAAGTRMYAFELERIPGIEIGGRMKIGAKVILKNVLIARELLLLQPSTATLLGGGVTEWNNRWNEERMDRLKKAIGEEKK